MKVKLCFFGLLFVCSLFFGSCTSENEEVNLTDSNLAIVDNSVYNYSASEIETMALINEYRKSIGLNSLEKLNFISIKSEGHANYLMANNVVNHNDFVSRSNEIITTFNAKKVSENIAYNYITPS